MFLARWVRFAARLMTNILTHRCRLCLRLMNKLKAYLIDPLKHNKITQPLIQFVSLREDNNEKICLLNDINWRWMNSFMNKRRNCLTENEKLSLIYHQNFFQIALKKTNQSWWSSHHVAPRINQCDPLAITFERVMSIVRFNLHVSMKGLIIAHLVQSSVETWMRDEKNGVDRWGFGVTFTSRMRVDADDDIKQIFFLFFSPIQKLFTSIRWK